VPFDFNPINLQDPRASSVVTYRELQGNPEASGNDAELLAASLDDANAAAKRLVLLSGIDGLMSAQTVRGFPA
jgi:hypothetical protein